MTLASQGLRSWRPRGRNRRKLQPQVVQFGGLRSIGKRILKSHRAAAEALVRDGDAIAEIDADMRIYCFAVGSHEAQDIGGLDIVFLQREAARASGEDVPRRSAASSSATGARAGRPAAARYDYTSGVLVAGDRRLACAPCLRRRGARRGASSPRWPPRAPPSSPRRRLPAGGYRSGGDPRLRLPPLSRRPHVLCGAPRIGRVGSGLPRSGRCVGEGATRPARRCC